MRRSEDRFLTTHAGSLVRPDDVIAAMRDLDAGRTQDEAAVSGLLPTAVRGVVRQQHATGIDVPSDGEFGKRGWTAYVAERLGGLETVPIPYGQLISGMAGRDSQRFAGFYQAYNRIERELWLPETDADPGEDPPPSMWQCNAPITYTGMASLQRDIANFKAALSEAGYEEGFLPVAAPASVTASRANNYYKTDEDYIYAVADALSQEYHAIVDAGLLLQVDDAFLPAQFARMPEGTSIDDYRKFAAMAIEALNHALEGIPEDRVRYHICWGSQNVPHTWDVPLEDLIDLVLSVKAQGYSIEAGNPRHEHEWHLWEHKKLPDGKVLIPGVISHSTNVVEHPLLVADRIGKFAELVGRENVIASTDCGFSQNWNLIRVHPDVQWAKLETLVEGARIASERFWPRPVF